jgi:hypothetical protein
MLEENWDKWFQDERKKLQGTEGREGKRGYLHFDKRIPNPDEKLTRALLEPANVAAHSFRPFIRIDTREHRYRRMKNHAPGDRRREHSIKKRPIDYASHKDALVFSWYARLLSEKYEAELARRSIGNHVIAYRTLKNPDGSGKTNVHFAKEAFDFIEANQPCHALAIDVTKFFEEIDHALLHKQWSTLVGVSILPADHYRVFKAITDYRFVRKGRMRELYARAFRQHLPQLCTPKEFRKLIVAQNLQEKGCPGERMRGIPQGAPISCVLANAYMLDFDTAVAAFVASLPKGFYQRYSDDILIVCAPENAQKVVDFVTAEIKKLKLQIKPQKTEHRLFVTNDGVTQSLDPKNNNKETQLQYLGVTTDGENRYLRHGSVARSQRRLSKGVRRAINFAQAKGKPAPKRFLHKKYALPHQNFLSYAKRAENTLQTGNIPQQVSGRKAAQTVKKLLSKSSEKK